MTQQNFTSINRFYLLNCFVCLFSWYKLSSFSCFGLFYYQSFACSPDTSSHLPDVLFKHSFAMGYSATIALPVHLIQALFCNGLFCYQSTRTYYFIKGLIYNSDSDRWDTHCECHLQHTENENVHLMAFIAMRGVLTEYRPLTPTWHAKASTHGCFCNCHGFNTWPMLNSWTLHIGVDWTELACPLALSISGRVVTNFINQLPKWAFRLSNTCS